MGVPGAVDEGIEVGFPLVVLDKEGTSAGIGGAAGTD